MSSKRQKLGAYLREIPAAHRLVKRIRRVLRPAWLGTARRTSPFSDVYGFDRGMPVDRYYIEQFLRQYRSDVKGHVIEVKSSEYGRRFGINVTEVAILDIDATNSDATVIADLAAADSITSNHFDCFLLTQTLQFIYDVPAALAHAHRILRPGGVLLATVPSVDRIANDYDGTSYWRFTPASCRRLFGEVFGDENVAISASGNVLSCVAHLLGMAQEELSERELETFDPRFPLIISVRAVKR